MAEKLETLEQLIEFVVRLQPEAVAQVARETAEVNRRRAADTINTEEQIVAATAKANDEKLKKAKEALTNLEKELHGSVDKELEFIEQVKKANDLKYEEILKKAKEAAAAQLSLSKALNEADMSEYDKYLKNKEALDKRAADLKNPNKGPTIGEIGSGIGGFIGTVARAMPGETDEQRTVKELGNMTEGILKSTSIQGALLEVGKAALNIAVMAYQEDLRRERAAVDIVRGGLLQERGIYDTGTQARVKETANELEKQDYITSKDKDKIAPVLAELNRALPKSSDVANYEQTRASFEKLITAADQLGEDWTGFTRKIADFARKENLPTVDAAANQVKQITSVANEIAKNFKEIDTTKFVNNVLQVQDAMRPFGFTIQETTNMVGKFAVELDRGVISINDLISYATGATRADKGALAAVSMEITKLTGDQFKPLQDALKNQANNDPLAMQHMLRGLTENNTQMMQSLGIDAKDTRGRENMQQMAMSAVRAAEDSLVKQMTGGATGMRAAAIRQMAFEEMEQMLGQSGATSGKTLELQDKLRAGQGEVAAKITDKGIEVQGQLVSTSTQQVELQRKMENHLLELRNNSKGAWEKFTDKFDVQSMAQDSAYIKELEKDPYAVGRRAGLEGHQYGEKPLDQQSGWEMFHHELKTTLGEKFGGEDFKKYQAGLQAGRDERMRMGEGRTTATTGIPQMNLNVNVSGDEAAKHVKDAVEKSNLKQILGETLQSAFNSAATGAIEEQLAGMGAGQGTGGF